MTLLLSILFGWAFDRAQMVMSAPNYNSPWNGQGCIDLVNKREARAPMAYRVLVPWLVALIERSKAPLNRITIYSALKLAGVVYAFWAVSEWIGMPGALIVFILLLVTVQYDYWDWTFELGGLAMAMSGNIWLTIIGMVLWLMSRETWPLAAAAFWFVSQDTYWAIMVLMGGGILYILLHMYIGKKTMYCNRFMVKENWNLIKLIHKYSPVFYVQALASLVLTLLVLASIVRLPVGWPIPLVILISGWTMAKADEPRVFSAALPWAAAWIMEVM